MCFIRGDGITLPLKLPYPHNLWGQFMGDLENFLDVKTITSPAASCLCCLQDTL